MSRDVLLERLLEALVHEWGHERVQSCLSSLDRRSLQSQDAGKSGGKASRAEPSDRPRRKATALDLALKVRGPVELREVLATIAAQFDEKVFLPTIGDVRQFLEFAGKQLPATTSRGDSFRHILDELVELPVNELTELSRQALISGPSRLGPLSAAIRTAGDSLRPGLEDAPHKKPSPEG